MKGDADEGEESMVYDSSPTYEEVVMKVRSVLNWIDPNDEVKLIGRYEVELRVLQIDLNRHASSPIHDRRVEVYVPNSSSQTRNEAEMNDRAMVIQEEEVHVDVDAAHVDDDDAHVYDDAIDHVDAYTEVEDIHYNTIGNLDVILYQQDMDRSLPYSLMYGYDSDDEGPTEELDDDVLIAQERKISRS
ncbi:Nucleoside diphosphate kinase 4, chloroplastic [Hordeum vulgare]|nr:Nucleoside diphosphate kinase 4, chloroplastic [Hordeum vulgare]